MNSNLLTMKKHLEENELSADGMNFIKSLPSEELLQIVPKLLKKESEKVLNFLNSMKFEEQDQNKTPYIKKEVKLIEDKDRLLDIKKYNITAKPKVEQPIIINYQAYKSQPISEIIRHLMFFYGDPLNNKAESVMEMRNILKGISTKIFKGEKLRAIIGEEKESLKELPLKKRKAFKSFIESIFPEQWETFSKKTSFLRNINLSRTSEGNLIKQQNTLGKLGEKEIIKEFCVSTEAPIFFTNYNEQQVERNNFLSKREDQLSIEEFKYYTDLRKTKYNFLKFGINPFIEFINVKVTFLTDSLLEFISYSYCKLVQMIIETCLRARHNGKLDIIETPLTPEEIIESSKSFVLDIEKRVKAWGKKTLSFEDLAFKAFSKDFYEMDYYKLFLGKEKKQEESSQENEILNCWKKSLRTYKAMWVQRIMAEIQIKNLLKKKVNYQNLVDIQFVNEYAEHLWEQLSKEKIRNALDSGSEKYSLYSNIFKKWLFNDRDERIEEKDPSSEESRQKFPTDAFTDTSKEKRLKRMF